MLNFEGSSVARTIRRAMASTVGVFFVGLVARPFALRAAPFCAADFAPAGALALAPPFDVFFGAAFFRGAAAFRLAGMHTPPCVLSRIIPAASAGKLV
jgi:hypothetical protein